MVRPKTVKNLQLALRVLSILNVLTCPQVSFMLDTRLPTPSSNEGHVLRMHLLVESPHF